MTEAKVRRKRRKKKRKALWITLITLLILGGGGWGGFHYLTHKDVQAEDIGVEENFFDLSEFEVIVDPDKPSVSNTGKEEVESPSDANSGNSTDETNADSSDANVDNVTQPASGEAEQEEPAQEPKPDTKPKDVAQEIENKYSGTFKSLESVAISKINTLAENALRDYRSGRSLTDLSSTYMSASNKLENSVDATFYKLLDEMKAELKANNLNDNIAQKAESAYKQAIAAKKSEMLGKVAQFK